MTDDAELLRRYAEENAEEAFAEFVRRNLGLVYHAALRQCGGDAHRAQDVAQTVFTDVARKARSLARRPALAGWLHTSTRYAAAQAVRGEVRRLRRLRREQEAHAMNEILEKANGENAASADWARMRPVIDEALHVLGERDREAVLARFFEGRGFAEVGARLALSEDAARMRVERALEKLRVALVKRGVNSTAAALGIALASQAGEVVPTGVAASVTGAALAGGSVGLGSAMVFMGTIKLQVGITAMLVVAGTTGFIMQSRADAALRDEIAGLRGATSAGVVGGLREENRRLAALAVEVEELRKDDEELARLRDEVAAVKARQEQAARAAPDARAKRAAEIAAMPVYAEAQVDVQPKPKFQGGVTVPNTVRQVVRDSGQNAEAKVSYVVNADGGVSDVQVMSATHPDWAEAAAAAVKQWQFEPARKNGEVVNMRRETPVVFTMETKIRSEKELGRRFWF